MRMLRKYHECSECPCKGKHDTTNAWRESNRTLRSREKQEWKRQLLEEDSNLRPED